jgi:hypothetical protein
MGAVPGSPPTLNEDLRGEPSTPPVPREYRALYTYLEHRYGSVVVLTLEQIDARLGFALPAPARTERNWWTGTVDMQTHSAAWIEAGRTAAPDVAARTMTFERTVYGKRNQHDPTLSTANRVR